jgi:predicted PurR-regulated permease PerM
MDRLRNVVYVTVLLVIIGWLLSIGKAIFVPAVLGAVVVYVIVGIAQGLKRLPGVGRTLPAQVRYLFSILLIGTVFGLLIHLVMSNLDRAVAMAPHYQQSLLAAIQRLAVHFGIETEPTWATLRQELVQVVNLPRMAGSLLTSVGSLLITLVVVCLYAVFLLVERPTFEAKLSMLSDDPRRVQRLREVIGTVNSRVGSYLALKTLLSVLLGVISYAVMRFFDLEFAELWAVLIAFLNFVPYVGSALGVVVPMLVAVVQFEDPATMLQLLLVLGAVQFVIGNFVDPYLMSSSLNLSPFAILVSLAVWSELWGIPGAFLAVPVTVIITIVFSQVPSTRPMAVLLSKRGQI